MGAAPAAVSGAGELPEHWESRTDNLGRVFYIDHLNRATTWKRPRFSSKQSTLHDRLLSSEMEKQRLDKRYQSIRRTINQKETNVADPAGDLHNAVISN